MSTIKIGLVVKFSKDLTQSILIETGNIVSQHRLLFTLTDEAAKQYRRHFTSYILAWPSIDNKLFDYTLDEPTDGPIDTLTPESLYEAWKLHCKSQIVLRLAERGKVSSVDNYFLDGILAPAEEAEAVTIYNNTLLAREADKFAREEKNRLQFEADRAALKKREEEEAAKKALAEHSPEEWIMPLSTLSGLSVSTENPLKWRTKNWIAIVERNPKKPGGLERKFFDKSKLPGSFYIIPENVLKPGLCIEFGSVDIDKRGRESKFYRSMVVKEVYQDKIVLAHCLDDNHMFRYSEYFLKQSLIQSITNPKNSNEVKNFTFTTIITVKGTEQTKAWDSLNAMTLKDLLAAGMLMIEGVEISNIEEVTVTANV